MLWGAFWASIISNPVAAYAAAVGTIAALLAVPTAIQNWRRNKRDRGLLAVDNASAGHVLQSGFRYENVVLVLVNVGLHTVSITKFELKIYEGLLNRILGRVAVRFQGDGWRVDRKATAFALSLHPGNSVPISVKAGESVRLEIHAPYLWPDRRRRAVVVEVCYRPSAKPLKVLIKPRDPWNYTDEQGLADQERLIPSTKVKQFINGQWADLASDGQSKIATHKA